MMCACGMQAGIKKINKMNTEILGSVLQVVALVVLAYPLGCYIAKVYKGERTWSDFMAPVEKWMYKLCHIDPAEEMNWKSFWWLC